ncbi:hypothetical protein DES39_1528 [Orbus hercynius]|uniref:Uncharacterized protein n=1 Tax=Orbus hercynius TaxID=593135 RepID=A0A495RF29_9GAMM|nr:hypothetical protein [Orbus hercynius]RKS86102.1 hypothetical protein DES39_1528 [Orbus hercynius]
MVKLTKILIISALAISLWGCYDKGELKNIIQQGYDNARANTQAKGDFCYYLGSVKFPYTDEPVVADDIQWTIWNKGKLSRSLPLFADIGLLTREPVAGQPGIYHYDLTELGREYQHMFIDPNYGDPIYNNAFCYGLIQLDKVTNVEEKEVGGGTGNANAKQTKVYVSYNYHVLDIPAWVTHSQEKLDALYSQFRVMQEGVIYPDTKTFYKGKDGNLYQNSLSYFLIQP